MCYQYNQTEHVKQRKKQQQISNYHKKLLAEKINFRYIIIIHIRKKQELKNETYEHNTND